MSVFVEAHVELDTPIRLERSGHVGIGPHPEHHFGVSPNGSLWEALIDAVLLYARNDLAESGIGYEQGYSW